MSHLSNRCVGLSGGVLLAVISALGATGQTYQWSTLAGSAGGMNFRDGPAGIAGFKSPRAIVIDGDGNSYLTDTGNHTIRKISPDGVFSTLAGKGGIPGVADGSGNLARFNTPGGIAVDGAGNVYVADTGNHTIRKISPAGEVTTVAGEAGVAGHSDGTGKAAHFSAPNAIALESNGNLLVADTANHLIRRMTPGGLVTTIAGQAGVTGSTDGSTSVALFNSPKALTTDDEDSIYIADTSNRVIRKISAAGNVTTLAGLAGVTGNVDAIGGAARFSGPEGVCVDAAHNVFVSDLRSIRKIAAADAMVTTVAGKAGSYGSTDGSGAAARFTRPEGLVLGPDGSLLVADLGNHTIRRVTLAGDVTTVAANSTAVAGAIDAPATSARFNGPMGLTVDGGGSVYIADTGNRTLRMIAPSGVVTTVAGSAGLSGNTDATGTDARFTSPRAVAVGPGGIAYVADMVSNSDSTIRQITPAGAVTTLAGTPGSLGITDTLRYLSGLVVDAQSNVFASDQCSIRKLTPQGVVSVFAGSPCKATLLSDGTYMLFWKTGSDDGFGTAATFTNPSAMTIDAYGNLYVTDMTACVIRKVTPAGQTTTLAGKDEGPGAVLGSNDGTGSVARFKNPQGIAMDANGTLYIADSGNNTIRRLSPAGVVTTIGGLVGYAGSSDGTGDRALFNQPFDIAVDASGILYVADMANHRIAKGTPLPVPEMVVQHPDGSHQVNGGPGLAFGNVAPSTTSPPQILTVYNTGNTQLNITGLELTGDNGSEFAFDRADLPAQLPPNGSGVIRVTFSPNGLGARSATLTLSNNDAGDGSMTILLSGTGNTLPVFAGYAVSSPPVTPLRISLAKLLSAASDADGDAMAVTAVAWPSTSGGGLVLLDDFIEFYPSSPSYTGTWTFLATITDARGGSVTGEVSVTWQSTTSSGAGSMTSNPPKLTLQPDGQAGVTFHGIPNYSYAVQRSVDLATWLQIATVTADATGHVTYLDPAPPKPNAYYRIASP